MAAPSYHVTFLGTGSATPTPHRYLACVAVQRLGELFLFDCGEAAQIQYRRAGLGFGGLRAIFISHLHADHVLGLMGLLLSLQLADRLEPLLIYGPHGIYRFFDCNRRALSAGFGYAIEIREVAAGDPPHEGDGYTVRWVGLDHGVTCLGYAIEEPPRPGRFDLEAAKALGVPPGPLYGELQRGRAVTLADGQVIEAEAVVGPARPGAKLVYCTDTRPCRAAVEIAASADLLIHEGTFDAEMGRDAHTKGHSTVEDAARIAREAGVRQLAITHLSPRYADTAPLLQQARAVFPETVIARDLMRLDVTPLEAFPPDTKGDPDG